MKFSVPTLLTAALAIAAFTPLTRAADSVTLTPSLVTATAVGGGALPAAPPTFVSGNTLYIYGSAQPAVYTINYNVLANLAAGEGFSGVAAQFNPSAGLTIPATPYTPNGSPVWSFILPGAVNATINNTYGTPAPGDLVANIGPYTSSDSTRTAFAQTASAPVGQLKVQWDGTTSNATLKLSDTTSSTLNQIQFQTDNLSTGVVSNGVSIGGQMDVQFVAPLPGDANLDGTVALADYLSLSQNFGKAGGWTQGNFLGDATVDLADYLALSQNFGKTWTTGLTPAVGLGAVAAAPEPASLALLAVGAAGLLARRKNRNV